MKTEDHTSYRNFSEKYSDGLYHLSRLLNALGFKICEVWPEGQGPVQLAWNKAFLICEHIDLINCG